MPKRKSESLWGPGLLLCGTLVACDSGGSSNIQNDAGIPGRTVEGQVAISGATQHARGPLAFGVNYWNWVPAYGTSVSGTEADIQALSPALLRIGGHNNDWNSPAPFDDAELDTAIAYARAIGAEPIVQVPVLADTAGLEPSAATAAQMVTYANVTQSYGVKYFSIGNEPDIYGEPDQTPNQPGYAPGDYCAKVKPFAAAMRAADPSIQILGPELSWKYQNAPNDWLTPILQECGDQFDIVSVHRYPIDPAATTIASAAADAAQFKNVIAQIRAKMSAAGMADKPLALTETNLTWNGDPAVSTHEASPGTLPAGLWALDLMGVSLEANLWTTIPWSIREYWTLGLINPDGDKRPAYQALGLYSAHFGPTLLEVTAAPSGVHAYASRNALGDATLIVVANWTSDTQKLSFAIRDLAAAPAPVVFDFEPMSMGAVEIPDVGGAFGFKYGEPEFEAGSDPSPLSAH